MISVIIPVVYNRGWLDGCIKSAINQQFDDYEIILASDNNPNLSIYAEKYNLRFILNKGKHNLSTNYNNAVRIAKGEYLKMLMDDDELTPNCLKDLYENIGTADMIYASAINFRGGGSVRVRPGPVTFNSIYANDGIHTGTIMIKRSTFLDLGGNDESLNCMEDYDLNLRLLNRGYKMTYIDKVVYRYRIHQGQKSYRMTPERIQTKKYIRNKFKMKDKFVN